MVNGPVDGRPTERYAAEAPPVKPPPRLMIPPNVKLFPLLSMVAVMPELSAILLVTVKPAAPAWIVPLPCMLTSPVLRAAFKLRFLYR